MKCFPEDNSNIPLPLKEPGLNGPSLFNPGRILVPQNSLQPSR